MLFHAVEVADGLWARPKLENAQFRSCEFAFANIYMWSRVYGTEIAEEDGFVIARNVGRTHHHFLYPVGGADLAGIMEKCVQDSVADNRLPMFYSIPESEIPKIEALFPGRFDFTADRKDDDYLYFTKELQELPGKKYQKKRNHVSRFLKDHPDCSFEKITPENLPEVRRYSDEWYARYANGEESLLREKEAVELVFDSFFELELVGGLLRAGGRVVSYCYGSFISAQVLDTHVEKAWHDMNGDYSVINREFARAFGGSAVFINREDDLGDEGLRRSKLSYEPAALEKKYYATLKQTV